MLIPANLSLEQYWGNYCVEDQATGQIFEWPEEVPFENQPGLNVVDCPGYGPFQPAPQAVGTSPSGGGGGGQTATTGPVQATQTILLVGLGLLLFGMLAKK